MTAPIPPTYLKYFWDTDFQQLSLQHDSTFIIERLLEYGELDSIEWLQNNYPKEEVIKVLRSSKRISPKTGVFYALYFDISESELECIRKPFTQKQNRHL